MSLDSLNSRQVLFNIGAAVVTYGVAKCYSQNPTPLLSQAAVSLTLVLVKPLFEKQICDDKKYSLGSFALIAATGALCRLSWKINMAVALCLALGSYKETPCLALGSYKETPSSPNFVDRIFSELDWENLNLDGLAEVQDDEEFFNTGMTYILATQWTFNKTGEVKDIVAFLDRVIDHFKEQPERLKGVLCTPNNPKNLPDCTHSRNTPLVLLIRMGGDQAFEAVQKILPYYDEEALFTTTPRGNTPLHYAAIMGQFEVAMALMQQAEKLGKLQELLDYNNFLGFTADMLMQQLFVNPSDFKSLLWVYCLAMVGGYGEQNDLTRGFDSDPLWVRANLLSVVKEKLGVDKEIVHGEKGSYPTLGNWDLRKLFNVYRQKVL
ncbi:MAG: ankyrin repeat domain-containing protein [Chlamydiia bacterium]|nr:ankyrin repeat domain-containing protein [Chlamydiia bacterium]